MSKPSPRTARAYVLERLGYDGVTEREHAVPPTPPRHVLIRIRAASLNFRDLKIIKGTYARPPKLPIIILSDGAGEVIDVGSGVTQLQPGARVVPVYMQGWHTGPMTAEREGWKSRGGDIDGTATEYVICHENDVVRIPDALSYEQAACLPCAAVTAWHALVFAGRVKAGDTVLTMGSGGVSVFALQFARISGAHVIATSRHDSKAVRLKQIGAAHTINTTSRPDWADEVMKVTHGRGVDHVIEVGGEGTIVNSIRATREGGQIHVIGDLTGTFPSKNLAARGVTMKQITVGSREMLEETLRAIDRHREMPVIDRSFPLAELREALTYLELGDHFGKVVVTL